MLQKFLSKNNLFIYILIILISYIITFNIGYDRNNIIFDTLILSSLLMISRINIISTFICLLFLIFSAIYAPIGNVYGVLTSEMIYAVFQTNASEATEFIKLIPIKNIFITLLILLFSIFFLVKRQKENSSKLILILFFYILFCTDYCWPSRLIMDTYRSIRNAMLEINTYLTFSQQVKDQWQVIPEIPKYNTTVVVIGESVGKNYMSVYGFNENTTPWLNDAHGIFINGYISSAAFTINSLSRSLIMNYEKNKNLANNVVTLANKSNYETYWISNQGSIGEHDTLTSVIGHSAKNVKFLKTGQSKAQNKDDYDLLPYIYHAIHDNSKPKIIFVHMIGSHENTCDRLFSSPDLYQKKFNKYISCYLSSINKLDNFLKNIDSSLKNSKKSFAMLYFSDHGLYVNDKKNLVRHNPNIQESYQIPLIITTSDIHTHRMVNTHLSAYDFPSIFQWVTGIKTKNLDQINPQTTQSKQPIMVFNNQQKLPFSQIQ